MSLIMPEPLLMSKGMDKDVLGLIGTGTGH